MLCVCLCECVHVCGCMFGVPQQQQQQQQQHFSHVRKFTNMHQNFQEYFMILAYFLFTCTYPFPF